jgi:hypothetical protein
MMRYSLLLALLVALVVLSVPAGIFAIESQKDVIDHDRYGQGEFVGYRASLPARQYPEYANRPTQAADQAYLVPDTLRVTLQAGEGVTEHKILYLPEDVAPARGDIVFSFDLTGSMGNAIAEVKNNASAIMDSVRALIPDTYFGVISHQDYPAFYDHCGYAEAYGNPDVGDLPYMRNLSLTGNLAAVHGAINGLSLGDGADGPESYSRVLYEATADAAIGWRDGSTKIVILWGDNVPHDCDYRACIGGSGTTGGDPGRDGVVGNSDDLEILKVITRMALDDIMLLAMYNGLSATNLALWDCWSRKTGGDAFEINPDGTVPGGVDLPSYIASIISEQFTQIDEMTLQVCQPEYAEWLTDVNPEAYYNIVLDVPHELHFDITLTVPEGTPAGLYCFDICAVGDGAIYATQNVCIRVLPGGCIDLEIGCVYDAMPDEQISVPVYGGDFDDWGVTALDIEICWCDSLQGFMTFADCDPGEVLNNAGWIGGYCERSGESCITFHASGDTPLSGSGTLFTLDFNPDEGAAPCECCSLTFGSTFVGAAQGMPMPICPVECEVCMSECSVEGYVYNWYCQENGEIVRTDPIEGADVFLYWCGTPLGARVTDATGYYLFDCLAPEVECPYCVEADSDPEPGNIRAYDASLVLQYTVGALALEDCAFETGTGTVYPQWVAGEVSCNGVLQAYDASQILQYVVEKIDSWPCGYYWTFISSEGECGWGCNKWVDFIGVLLGDVSGPLPPAPAVVDKVPVWLGVPTHFDEYVEVPIKMGPGVGICSAEFEILFDADALSVESVEAVGFTDDFLAASNETDPGRLLVAIAGDDCLDGKGKIVMLRFKKKFLPMPVAEHRIVLENALFNEGVPEAEIEDKDWPGEVHGIIAFGPVSPNPFTAGTTVRFNLPSAMAVKVDVYDVTGQLVRSLLDAQASPGTHAIEWDGRDSFGSSVARGVYFVRMSAGDFRASEKIVLLR